jgi:MFS family permease
MFSDFLPQNLLGLVQSMVTPAVMISACGLLLLSMSNKLARLVDRIRGLNAEDRERGPVMESVRRLSVRNQIDLLVRRAVYLRYACGLLYLAVAVFAVTSLCIGLSNAAHVFEVLMLVLFVAGLGIVVWAGILAYLEMRLSHQAIAEEIKELRLHD